MVKWNDVKTLVGNHYGKLLAGVAALGIGYGVWNSDRVQAWTGGAYYFSNSAGRVTFNVDKDARKPLEQLLFNLESQYRLDNEDVVGILTAIDSVGSVGSQDFRISGSEVDDYRNKKNVDIRQKAEGAFGLRR